MATTKVVEFVKIVGTILKVSIVTVVRRNFTDQQINPGITLTYVNVSIHPILYLNKKSDFNNLLNY